MVLYHGTDSDSANSILTHGVDFTKCSESCDNGPGFYLGPNLKLAIEWAEYIADDRHRSPAVLAYDFNDLLARTSLQVISYNEESVEWQFFIARNRLGDNVFYDIFKNSLSFMPINRAKYDIAISPIADSHIPHVAEDLVLNHTRYSVSQCLSKILSIKSMRHNETGSLCMQYSFHTHRSLEFLERQRIIFP